MYDHVYLRTLYIRSHKLIQTFPFTATLKTVSVKYHLLYKDTLAPASLGWWLVLHAASCVASVSLALALSPSPTPLLMHVGVCLRRLSLYFALCRRNFVSMYSAGKKHTGL